jgi:hypothetical protein
MTRPHTFHRAITDDPVKRIAARLERIAAEIEQVKADVVALDSPGDIIAQLKRGELLVTAQAADVAERDSDSIQRWCNEAEEEGRPLGVLSPVGWLIGKARLLARIESKKGRHARIVAETRAKKYADTWSQPLQLLKRPKRAAG